MDEESRAAYPEVSTGQAPANASVTNKTHHGWAHFIASVEADPKFAKTMAESVAFIPDKLLIDLDDAPKSGDPAAWRAWSSQSVEFDSVAARVTEQRTHIYNEMKSDGSSDADIFKAIIEFNHSLPMEYQLKSGLAKIDIYA